MSAKRLSLIALSVVTILACYKFDFTAQLQTPGMKIVYVPIPFDRFANFQWSFNADYMESTCGTFKAYNRGNVENVNKRWYVAYTTNVPSTTNYCSQFTKVKEPCRCLGIDFTTSLENGAIQFFMFSTNTYERSVTYEIATVSMTGRSQLNFNQIILRSFVLHSNAKIDGKGGYIIPQGVVIDSDDFSTYMTILFCAEGATRPIVMVLSNALPMFSKTKNEVFKHLKTNGLDENIIEINHDNCKYAQNIVGF